MATTSKLSRATVNHEEIRRWAETRGGHPTAVNGTESGEDVGLLRIDFEGNGPEENLHEITWDQFFRKFEEKHLAFLYQDHLKHGEESRFFKFIDRDSADALLQVDDYAVRSAAESAKESFSVFASDTPETRAQKQPRVQPKTQARSEPANDPTAVRHLNALLRATLQTIDFYQQALEGIEDAQVCDHLRVFCEENTQHLLEIENLVYGLGGEPAPLFTRIGGELSQKPAHRAKNTH